MKTGTRVLLSFGFLIVSAVATVAVVKVMKMEKDAKDLKAKAEVVIDKVIEEVVEARIAS